MKTQFRIQPQPYQDVFSRSTIKWGNFFYPNWLIISMATLNIKHSKNYILCLDTLAASHLNRAVLGSGIVANEAESRKLTKCSSLSAFTTSFQLWSRQWVCRATKCYHYIMTSISSLQLPQLNHVHSSSWYSVWVLQYKVAMQLASWELCLLSGTNFFTFSIGRYTFKINFSCS